MCKLYSGICLVCGQNAKKYKSLIINKLVNFPHGRNTLNMEAENIIGKEEKIEGMKPRKYYIGFTRTSKEDFWWPVYNTINEDKEFVEGIIAQNKETYKTSAGSEYHEYKIVSFEVPKL